MSTAHRMNYRGSFAAATPNKTSPALSQHASPYQHQPHQPHSYPPPPTQHNGYPHLFSSPSQSPVPNIQNGTRQLPPQQTQRAPSIVRQAQPQQSQPLNYLQQTLNHQSMNHNHQVRTNDHGMLSQQQTQQSQSQPTLPPQQQQQQSQVPQIPLPQMAQNQQVQHQLPQIPLPQVQQQSQQIPQVQQAPQIQQVQHVPQASQVQVQHQVQQVPQIPQVQQVQQVPQVTQVQQVPQVQQLPQIQQQPTTQPEPAPQQQHQESRHDGEMEMESPGDDVDGHANTSLVSKGGDHTPFVPREPMGGPMSAPPEGGSYPSLEAVHKYVLEYCTSVGYAVVIGRSKKTVPGLKKVLFVCDRAGKPPKRVSPEMRKRKTSSRKCDCQFGFFAIEQRTQWTIRYRPDAQHLKHNHGPSESPLHHPAARKLDSKMVAVVKDLKDSGVGVSQTLEILQNQNPNVPLLPRDIYNARAAINRNPQRVAVTEERPSIYSKPGPTPEERIRTNLRQEIAQVKADYEKLKEDSAKEIAKLKEELEKKNKQITKFEMFIDICNQRVMVQRDMLSDEDPQAPTNGVPGGPVAT